MLRWHAEWLWLHKRYGDVVPGHFYMIRNYLNGFGSDRELRLLALYEFERTMRKVDSDHARDMVRAVAIWRLRKQLVADHSWRSSGIRAAKAAGKPSPAAPPGAF
jgi:hypothetical protein